MKKNIVLACSLMFLNSSLFAIKTTANSLQAVDNSSCVIKAENGDNGGYSEKQLQTIAKRITVRVMGNNNGGSGTLLSKRGNTYLVLTNSHVIRGVNSISLKTADGNTYNAKTVPNPNFDKFDLALLQFDSNENYCLTEVANFVPNTEMEVIAAGYSAAKGQIVFRTGTVQKISERPLKEGYQIGYSSDIEQGMSGGAIINSTGQLIGINGRSAYPILNTGYVYPDGSRPSEEEIQEMRKLSWGIPISTVLAQVETTFRTAYSLPLAAPNPSERVPEPSALTGWLEELEKKAKQFTVRIDSSNKGNGSGVIIAKEGDTYTVLTSGHVFSTSEDNTKKCEYCTYQILAPDGKQYAVEKSSIKLEEGVDLAVVKFRSSATYQVATLANYNPRNYEYILTAGYPRLGEKSPWRFTLGKIYSKEQGLLQTTQSDFRKNSSGNSQSVSQSAVSLTGGYELVYSSITFGGMSGGPVLDTQGRVIGIHGRSEGETAIDEKTGDAGSSGGRVQLGNSLGIPVSTFLALATRLNTQAQKVETTLTPELNLQKVESIQAAILSVDVSQGNTTASQWLERGNQLWRLRRHEEAVKAFDEAIKLKPAFIHLAYYGKGLALGSFGKSLALADRQKNYQEAVEKYQEAIAAFEQAVKYKSDFVAAWNSQSVIYRELKQLYKALVAINKAIQLQPNNPNLYNEKFSVLSALKNYAEAELAINGAIKLSPRSAFYYNRGVVYHQDQKKWELALADYAKAITINPDYAGVYYNRGTLYGEQKKWDLALADYNKAITINPNDDAVYNNRGLVYQDQKRWDLALADYNKAITINPNDDAVYNNRGSLYKDQKKWDLALADYNTAIKINDQYADTYYNRGLLYYEQKKWELALADFNKAISINPNDAATYNNRGNVYFAQKKWDLAIADFNKAIAIDYNYDLAYYNRGNLYRVQQKWDLALAEYNKAIEINSQNAEAYFWRGRIINTIQEKWELALVDFTKAIEINPQYDDAYFWQGNIYRVQKKWELALADYNKVIQINPQYAEAFYWRGIIYIAKEKLDLALADFTKAIAINPRYANAYFWRGFIYFEQKKSDLALADFNKAISINPDYADAYASRGFIYHQQGNYTAAMSDYDQAVAKDKNSLAAINNIGFIKYEQGDKETAIKQWQESIKINNQSAEPMLALAVALYGKGEQQQAYKLAATALELDKNFADVNFMKKNLWGDKIIADAQKLLSTPKMKTLLSQLR